MAGSCPPTAPNGPPQGAPQPPMLSAHRTRRRPPGSTVPPAAGESKAGPPQATQAKDDTSVGDADHPGAAPPEVPRRGLAACVAVSGGGGHRDGEAVEVSWPRGGLEVADVHWFAAGRRD